MFHVLLCDWRIFLLLSCVCVVIDSWICSFPHAGQMSYPWAIRQPHVLYSKAADPAVSVKGHCCCPAFAHLAMVRRVFEAAAEVGGQPFLALLLGGAHSQQSVCIDQKWDDSLGKRACHASLAPEFNPGGRRKGSSHKCSFVLHTCAVTFVPLQSHNEWFFLNAKINFDTLLIN